MYSPLEVSSQTFILIDQFSRFLFRKKYGYSHFVKSHPIMSLIWLKTGQITQVFSEKEKSWFTKLRIYESHIFVANNVLPSVTMTRCHMSNYPIHVRL